MTILNYITLSFVMKWLVAFVCIWAVASAQYWCGPPPPPQLCGPPPEPECPPEVIEVPAPEPVVGALTQIVNDMIAASASNVEQITALLLKTNQDFLDEVRELGGPGFNRCARHNHFLRGAAKFWSDVYNVIYDNNISIDQAFNAAVAQIEEQFSLVITQPLVRSWLRELRDIPRILRNLLNLAFENRRAQWYRISQVYAAELNNVMRVGLCHNPDEAAERFYRITRIAMEELAGVLEQLKNDFDQTARQVIIRALNLANQIYEVEVLALKYFVS